ncbi:hypothetical protein TREES_T100001839 [Tupaia chinensis]|uniref:Uncharacterized protein n=1 Tax=Tupaia chinensis TaxID=246437 RepID=L9KJY5_TUPCH|nr:hypothetical protein TREES_T100001839 [Tupaia chinensis]
MVIGGCCSTQCWFKDDKDLTHPPWWNQSNKKKAKLETGLASHGPSCLGSEGSQKAMPLMPGQDPGALELRDQPGWCECSKAAATLDMGWEAAGQQKLLEQTYVPHPDCFQSLPSQVHMFRGSSKSACMLMLIGTGSVEEDTAPTTTL